MFNKILLLIILLGAIAILFFLFNASKTLGDCEKIKDLKEQDDCYAKVASKNPSLCNSLEERTHRIRCVSFVAVNDKDYASCEALSNEEITVKDICYISYAAKIQDSKACDQIQLRENRIVCYSKISE